MTVTVPRTWVMAVAVVAVAVAALGTGAAIRWSRGSGEVAVAAGVAVTTPSTAPAPGGPVAVADVVAAVAPSVVAVNATVEAGEEVPGSLLADVTGTGFVLRSDGVIATAAHVVDGAWSIWVVLVTGERVPARVIGTDPSTDLALLQVDRTDLVPVTFGRTSAVRIGEPVIAIGHSLGLGTLPTVSAGVLSATERVVAGPDGTPFDHLLQTDAAINTGASGGPLLNERGEVIGVNTARITADDAEGLAFAICTDHALPALEALLGS